jgi:hypothetical protein
MTNLYSSLGRSPGVLVALVAGACQAGAHAQTAEDPTAPVQCYRAVDAVNLASETAIDLCSAALSDAPARCYVTALDQFHELSSQKIVDLCQRATSQEPIACYGHLAALGTLTEDQMIDYCQTKCGLGPAPSQVSSPACMNVAVERTGLALQTAGELCVGSRSEGPALCFLAGEQLHSVADSSLVQLCAESRRCQYYNVASQPASY